MSDKYILAEDGRTPIPCEDVLEWGRWVGENSQARIVAKTTCSNGLRVSTIFLGLNHNFYGDGPPILFETMVFPPKCHRDQYCDRYSTWEEAEAGHLEAVRKVESGEITCSLEDYLATTEEDLEKLREGARQLREGKDGQTP